MRYRLLAGSDDNDGRVLHGPILVLTDPAREKLIRSGASKSDYSFSWSRSDSMQLNHMDSSSIELIVSITNLGDTASVTPSLTFIVWGLGERQVATYRGVMDGPVPPASITDRSGPNGASQNFRITLSQLTYALDATRINSSDEITHVFAVVYDAPLDVPDKYSAALVQHSRRGEKYFGPSGIHPCRLSRKTTCIVPFGGGAFGINGNSVSHNIPGYSDIFITAIDAGGSSNLGLLIPDDVMLLTDLKARGVSGPHFSEVILPSGAIEFFLEQAGQKLTSADAGNAEISLVPLNADALILNWSDTGADRDKGDFVVVVSHR